MLYYTTDYNFEAKSYDCMSRLVLTYILIIAATVNIGALADNSLKYAITRVRQLQQQREFADAAKLLDKYIDNPPAKPTRQDSIHMTEILRLQGENFLNLGVTSRAADSFEQALKIAEATDQVQQEARLCNELFIICLNTGNVSMASDLLNRSLEIYRSLGDKIGQGKIINNIGILYYKQGDTDRSIEFYNRSLQMLGGDSVLRSGVLTNLAESYSSRGQYDIADKYLGEAISLTNGRLYTSDALQTWLNKAEIQAALGHPEKTREILESIGRNIDLEDQSRLVESYTQIARIYMEIGDSIPGLRWGLRAQEIADSLNSRRENEQLREIIVRYDSERIAEHNKRLELNVRRQKQLTWIMVMMTLVVVSFAVFLVHKIRSDKRKNTLIREQREQLHELERIEHDRKEKEFKEEIDYKNRQLTAFSIDAASINELHKIMIDSLKRLRIKGDSTARTEINEIISRLQNFNRKEVNEDFRVYFNEVHPDYIARLSEKFPKLTPLDLRLCTYLYLGMSTKEIASLTFREIRSVESSRLRLRKKLNISGDVSLHDFLRSI